MAIVQLTKDQLNLIKSHYAKLECIPLSSDSVRNYIPSNFYQEHYNRINKGHHYKLVTPDFALNLQKIINAHYEHISNTIGSPFRVVNIRAWSTLSLGHSSKGETVHWHTDHFEPGHMKMMLYIDSINPEFNGTTDLRGYGPITSRPGCLLLFDQNKIFHRAIAPISKSERPIIELTLQRTLISNSNKKILYGTNNDRHLRNPFLAYIIK